MKTLAKSLSKLFWACLLLLTIAGGVMAQGDERPRLRVVHAAPEIQKVDIYLGETIYFRNIYYTYISDYVAINPGNPKLSSRIPGAGFEVVALFDHTFTYEPNKDYTVVAAGKLLSNQRWTWLLEDDNKLPGEGTAKVRIVHAAYETPTTDFCLADVCHTLAFQENSGYFLIDPGAYIPKLHVNATGKTFVEIPPLNLKDNSVHTLFLVGQIGSQEGLKLLYTLDAGSLPPKGGPPPAVPGDSPPYPAPLPGSGDVPPPAYPPETGAFLSPELQAILVGFVLSLIGGFSFWVIRRHPSL
jgi:hypothetical protein